MIDYVIMKNYHILIQLKKQMSCKRQNEHFKTSKTRLTLVEDFVSHHYNNYNSMSPSSGRTMIEK